jgi:hypothetical protein
MCAVERETRLQIMVEYPLLPRNRVVAHRAFFTEPSAMRILLPVAINAAFGRITKDVRLMACNAFHVRVIAEQWESRQPMVKEYVVFPGRLVVAV